MFSRINVDKPLGEMTQIEILSQEDGPRGGTLSHMKDGRTIVRIGTPNEIGHLHYIRHRLVLKSSVTN